MAANSGKPELVAIVGPTASGKSALAMELAGSYHVEIISADSRAIYKGMDIGTSKPSLEDRAKVPHWGIDLINPGKHYSAAKFQNYARGKITEVGDRGNLPVLVGGTGLYLDSVLYKFKFPDTNNTELDDLAIPELQKMILEDGYVMPENNLNRRHLINSIRRQGKLGERKNLKPSTILIGLMPDDDVLREAIKTRAAKIFRDGVVVETEQLLKAYPRPAVIATGGIVYKICIRLINGEIDEQTATTLTENAEWQYARRQRTWFKRNNDIRWFKDTKTALKFLKSVLNT